MPADSPRKAKVKDGAAAAWRSHLVALASSLEAADGVDLLAAKAELSALLAKVASRVKSQGGGTLPERMALAACSASNSPLNLQDSQRLLAGITAKLRLRVDKADPCRGLVAASASGTWGLFNGQSFSFKASVKEVYGSISGQIRIEGLDFKADGDLSTGKFECDAKALIRASGVDLAEKDALRALVASLELLARRKAVGIADIDVLGVTFGLMRTACGLPASLLGGDDGSEAEDGAEMEEDEIEEDDEAKASDASGESAPNEGQEEAEEEAEEEKSDEEEEDKSEAEEKSEEEPEDDPAKEEQRKLMQKKLDMMMPPKTASDDEASACGDLPTKASDDEGDEKSERDEKDDEVPKEEEEDDDKDMDKPATEDDDDDSTVFVSKVAFKVVKDKLSKGKVPTQAELSRLADFDAVPDGEDVVCIDASVLGPAFTSPGDRKEAVKALVAQHSLKGAAELFIKAEEAAGLELGDDEGEEEESEEEDEEEQEAPTPKAAPRGRGSSSPKAPPAKAPASKAAPAKAPVKVPPGVKAPAAKQPAAKRARTC